MRQRYPLGNAGWKNEETVALTIDALFSWRFLVLVRRIRYTRARARLRGPGQDPVPTSKTARARTLYSREFMSIFYFINPELTRKYQKIFAQRSLYFCCVHPRVDGGQPPYSPVGVGACLVSRLGRLGPAALGCECLSA